MRYRDTIQIKKIEKTIGRSLTPVELDQIDHNETIEVMGKRGRMLYFNVNTYSLQELLQDHAVTLTDERDPTQFWT